MPNDPVEIQYTSPGGLKVKVSIDDDVSGYLSSKLEAGTGINITTIDTPDGETLVISATGAVGDANVNQTRVAFSYLTGYPQLIKLVDNGEVVSEVKIIIEQAFDGVTSLKVGNPGALDRLMLTTDNDPYTTGQYSADPEYQYTSDDSVNLYLTATGSTMGSGYVVLTIQTL